ncbi:hypothetical protein [Nostoc sp.]|uniref:hypothetical protein n=1 Tax=Nostoc sp. TaxID=1180 RepID=UPI002FF50A2A
MQRNIISIPNHPGYVSGRYYQNTQSISSDSTGSTALATNSITYSPFRIDRNINIDRLAISCAGTVTNGVARIGIYANNNGLPANLLVDAGEIVAATAGIKEAIISLGLSPDWYWFAGATSTPPNLYNVTAFVGNNYILGQSTPSSVNPSALIRNTGFTYGAFPAVAPIGNLSFITGNTAPLFWFRVI